MNKFSPQFWQRLMLLLIIGGVLALALGGYLAPILKVAFTPLIGAQQWLSNKYIAVVEFFTMPRDVATLRQLNSELENKVSSLETQLIQLQDQLREAQVLYALLDFARARPENTYVAASVIGRDPVPFLRFIQIDKGTDDGIRHGMPVVTQQGLVGRVDAVTAGAARVQLITDANVNVNVRLQSSGVDAMLSGSVTGEVTLNMVPQDVVLKPGELILTSGLGGNYPAGIVVGQVVTVRKRETDLFQTASIQPSVDLTNMPAVLVITNFRPSDLTPLQPPK
ncbi:MAG TPA: rod shape-determining protein MreC [Anaerolineaceae bacterium]|nr:rod shape-determining protein MreC [Anaerolineaceae bacterium]